MMISRDKPPPERPGRRWIWLYREGCKEECTPSTCPWFGGCKGEAAEHWISVKNEMPQTAMREDSK